MNFWGRCMNKKPKKPQLGSSGWLRRWSRRWKLGNSWISWRSSLWMRRGERRGSNSRWLCRMVLSLRISRWIGLQSSKTPTSLHLRTFNPNSRLMTNRPQTFNLWSKQPCTTLGSSLRQCLCLTAGHPNWKNSSAFKRKLMRKIRQIGWKRREWWPIWLTKRNSSPWMCDSGSRLKRTILDSISTRIGKKTGNLTTSRVPLYLRMRMRPKTSSES